MEIIKKLAGSNLTVSLTGQLDTVTAPELEASLTDLSGITEVIFDFEKLEYVSSAGLRVLLATHKTMLKNGKMVIKNVNESIMEVFEITGFTDVFDIE